MQSIRLQCRARSAVCLHVAEHEVLEVGVAQEWNDGPLTHGAVSTVAADEVPRSNVFLDSVGASKDGVDTVVVHRDVHELDATFHAHAPRCEVSPEKRFGLGLRDKQDERETRVGSREAAK